MDFKGTRGKWKHKKGKRAKFEYDNFILDDYGNHILKWSNTGNGSHKLTMKESHANGLLISKAPEMLEMLQRLRKDVDFGFSSWGNDKGLMLSEELESLIKEATEL